MVYILSTERDQRKLALVSGGFTGSNSRKDSNIGDNKGFPVGPLAQMRYVERLRAKKKKDDK